MKLYAVKGPDGGYVMGNRGQEVFPSKVGAKTAARWALSDKWMAMADSLPEGYELIELTAGETVWLDEEVQPLLMQLASYKQFMVTMAASLADFARERMAFEEALGEARGDV